MKQLEIIFRTFCLFFFCTFLSLNSKAEETRGYDELFDSVEISLITCSPHEEIYSLYGHTALRFHDLRNDQDIVFNYGIFNIKASHFVLRFMFGLTDYELGTAGTQSFCNYYRRWGSAVREQVLNLSNNEKARIAMALEENLRPENRIYRYNFFFDNCATRPRDIIEKNANGRIVYDEHQDDEQSFRQLIRNKNGHHPWARLGNDLLLGVSADRNTTFRERQFLPDYLERAIDGAVIQAADGTQRMLVKEKRTLVEAGTQTIEKEFPLTPTQCAIIVLLITAGVSLWEIKHRRTWAAFDVILMTATGLTGIIIFLMFFSQHPTTSTNLQLLLLNPLPLFYVGSVAKHRKRAQHYWTIAVVLLVLFLFGNVFQNYAEGTNILASCLLIRALMNKKYGITQ